MIKSMKSFEAVLLSFSLAAITAGCSSPEPADQSAVEIPATAITDSTVEPSVQKLISVGVPGKITSLDPGMSFDKNNDYLISHLYSAMFQVDTEGKVVPMLAKDYDISDDGLVYTFHLKDGIKWSDGTPITAYDFEYTYLRNLSYGKNNAFVVHDLSEYIAGAEEYCDKAYDVLDFDCTSEDHSKVGIKAVDDKTFELTLNKPFQYLTLKMCGGPWIPLPQSTPQHNSMWSLEAGNVSSGPYILTELDPEKSAHAVKNENYFDNNSVTMDEINFAVLSDQSTQAFAFENRMIDIAVNVSKESLEHYLETENLFTYIVPESLFVVFNQSVNGPEWAKDVRVRKALAKAINTEKIIDALGGETFYQKLEGYVPVGFPGISKDFRIEGNEMRDHYELAYDPQEAVKLLAEAGYTENNPLHIEYLYPNSKDRPVIAKTLQKQWTQIGVDVDIISVETTQYYGQIDVDQFETGHYGLTIMDPIGGLDDLRTSPVAPKVSDELYGQSILNAKNESDYETAIKLCHEAEDYLINETVFLIPLIQTKKQILVQTGLSGLEVHGTRLYLAHCIYLK